MEDDLAALFAEQQVSCRIWPEQTQGPYHRDTPPERRDITEDRGGLPLRLGLRLVDASTGDPLSGSTVEVWQADHEGRYSGFLPLHARPGQVVTSASVPHEIVAPAESFLRGRQRTDTGGMCAFDTIYPGWYSSRTVHIHVAAWSGDHRFVSQLYFPDELTDQVFGYPPYSGRPVRDTTNATDSIFAEGGERTLLHLMGNPATSLTGVLCLELSTGPSTPITRGG